MSVNPLVARFHNLFWELRLGISTHGIVETGVGDASHYATMRYATINRILDHLRLRPDDVFIDVGSGKGRVLCCAARSIVREVVGVEIVPEFCRIAERNAQRMRGRKSPIRVYNVNAQQCDYSRGTVVTLFNPFGADTLSAVMGRIEESLQAKPRPLRLAYANPEHDSVIRRLPWLECYDEWSKNNLRIEHSVTFYRSRQSL
ncbi:MAG: hypothetical protein C4326_11905 [Ignavibacteria bacterium]